VRRHPVRHRPVGVGDRAARGQEGPRGVRSGGLSRPSSRRCRRRAAWPSQSGRTESRGVRTPLKIPARSRADIQAGRGLGTTKDWAE
jgi:hypothetical protein